MASIIRALDDNAGNAPDKTAVSGSRISLTWRELHDEVAVVAERLQGVSTLGVLMENSPAWIVTDLAAIHAGVVSIPLP